jgi:flagellar hook-length control protein FliK
MPTVLPAPAILDSTRPQGGQRLSRATGIEHVQRKDHQPRRGKFSDALRDADAPQQSKDYQISERKPRDASEPSRSIDSDPQLPAASEPAAELVHADIASSAPVEPGSREHSRESSENESAPPRESQNTTASRDQPPTRMIPLPVQQLQIPAPDGRQLAPPLPITYTRDIQREQTHIPAPEHAQANKNRSPIAANQAVAIPIETEFVSRQPSGQFPAPAVQQDDDAARSQQNTRQPKHPVEQPVPPAAQIAKELAVALRDDIGRDQARTNAPLLNSSPTIAPNRKPSEHAPASTERSAPSDRLTTQPTVRIEPQPQSATPAVARAMQVESAVRSDNAMAQATPGDQVILNNNAAAPHTAPQPTLTQSLHVKSDNLAQQLPTLSAPIDDSPLTGQVVRGLSAMVNQRGGTMNLRLDPPDLGQLRIQMTVARGVVTAEFHATTPQAHELLERNMAALRSTLEGHGLTVERLNVQVAAPTSQQMTRDDSNANTSNQHRQQHDAAGGESRGRRDGQQEFRREYAFEDFQILLKDLDQFALR